MISAAWLSAVGGERQALFVGGEPGVGKSRLVAEAASVLQHEGAAVLVGKCVDNLGAPYQPFVEPLATLLRAIATGQLRLDVPVDGELDRLRTMVGTDRSGITIPVGRQFTQQLFQTCVRALVAAARTDPLVLLLEDLQWAGETSLQLLRYLVQRTAESRLLVLATHRTALPDRSGELVRTVASLYPLDGVGRIDLGGLATEDITEFLVRQARVSARAARGPAAVLRDQTGGNPFLLRELWRELASVGDPDGPIDLSALGEVELRAPESVCDNISHRLQGMPSRHRRTVETAAVIGEEFSVRLLAATSTSGSGADPAGAFAGLDAAAAVGLVEPVRGRDDVFRFPHAIARQAVLDLMTQYQRARDHARVAVVLEESFPAADLRIQRLAHHYACAQSLGYGEKAVSYLVQAANAAENALAHHEAARFFERAAAITSDPGQRDELRLQSAGSYLHASKFVRARELNEQVATTVMGEDRLRAAIGFEAASWRTGQPGERAVQLLTPALAEVLQGTPTHVWGIAALGRACAFSGDFAAARVHGSTAVELARRTGDTRILALALEIGLHDGMSPEGLDDKLARATELTALAEQLGELRHLGPAAHYRGAVSYIMGDPVGLAAAHADFVRTVRATGEPFWEWVQRCISVFRLFIQADFVAAMKMIGEATELSRSFGPGGGTDGAAGLQQFVVRRETGGLERARPLVSGREDPTQHWAPALLAMYCELELREPASRLLALLVDRELPQLRTSSTWPAVLAFLCEAAIWLDDRNAAQQLHPLIAEYAGLNLMGAEFLAALGSADRQLGGIESVLGLPTADQRFVSALEMDTRMGSPVHMATTLACHVAHLRRVRDGSARMQRMTDRARLLIARYGLVRVRRLLDTADPVSVGRPAGLTAREAEVLRLVGDGLSNRQIAEALLISENTAANHVRNILMKTGAANRTQAARFAATHGMSGTDSRGDDARSGVPGQRTSGAGLDARR